MKFGLENLTVQIEPIENKLQDQKFYVLRQNILNP